jgi:hypothetical protein|tara:strand:+ start:730 stop:1308 length:579 start_codon:yes stop_codon:yes gene_type:complete
MGRVLIGELSMSKFTVHENFLDTEFFEETKNTIIDLNFPWRRRDSMTSGVLSPDPVVKDLFSSINDVNDSLFFAYTFYNKMEVLSDLYKPYVIPILEKLEAVAPIQVRANMSISALYKQCHWHRDYGFKCKTAILYLNDCDGGTELNINNEITFIKADANKMLIFDTDILHRGITSKEQPVRYIINFNYFTH